MSAPTEPAPEVPITQQRAFWVLMGYAVALGVFGAFTGLVFVGVIDFGGKWYADSDSGWFGGHWWWVAVTAGAGVVVGLLRRLTRLPEQIPGLFADLKSEHVDPGLVPGIAAVSAVSLVGGASLGPEKALGAMGGGAGTWLARRRALGKEDSQVNTLVGFTGAYGGLFSSTVIVVMLILEAARPGGRVVVTGGVVADDEPRRLMIEMVLLGGTSNNLAEFRELARAAGLEVVAAERQPSGRFVVECRPT